MDKNRMKQIDKYIDRLRKRIGLRQYYLPLEKKVILI